MTVYDPPPRQATLNPFLRLTRNEARILSRRFRACPETPPADEIATIERIAGWLEQVAR